MTAYRSTADEKWFIFRPASLGIPAKDFFTPFHLVKCCFVRDVGEEFPIPANMGEVAQRSNWPTGSRRRSSYLTVIISAEYGFAPLIDVHVPITGPNPPLMIHHVGKREAPAELGQVMPIGDDSIPAIAQQVDNSAVFGARQVM